MVLDANRADGGEGGGGDGRIGRGQPRALISQTGGDSAQIDSEHGGSEAELFLISSMEAHSVSSGSGEGLLS